MVTSLRVLLQYLCKPVLIWKVFDNLPWHCCCCTRHTGLHHFFSPSFPFLLPSMPAAGKHSCWEPGICESQVDARNGDWALVLEGEHSSTITHQHRKVSLHWIPWHNPIKCFSSKQKTLSVQIWCLIDSFNTKTEGKAMFLSTAYQEYFNNQ